MVRLSIPAQLAFRDLALSAVLTAIDAAGEGPHAEARDEIISAFNEAYNNVVLHAYQGIQGGSVDLSVSVRAGEVEVQISDRGRGFDPSSVELHVILGGDDDQEIDIAALPESGMGLFIIRSFMDDVTYTRGAAGAPNILVLRKRWPVATSRPAAEGGPRLVAEGASRLVAEGASRPAADPAERPPAPRKETSQSGWRMRSVAVPSEASALRTAGSLKRK